MFNLRKTLALAITSVYASMFMTNVSPALSDDAVAATEAGMVLNGEAIRTPPPKPHLGNDKDSDPWHLNDGHLILYSDKWGDGADDTLADRLNLSLVSFGIGPKDRSLSARLVFDLHNTDNRLANASDGFAVNYSFVPNVGPSVSPIQSEIAMDQVNRDAWSYLRHEFEGNSVHEVSMKYDISRQFSLRSGLSVGYASAGSRNGDRLTKVSWINMTYKFPK